MSLNVFWFYPPTATATILAAHRARSVDHSYLQQIARAADRLGFGGY